MESKEILEILNQINKDDTYKKIFINGAWGIGKSYYTNQYINKNPQNFIYISLFGKNTFDSIEEALAEKLIKKINLLNRTKREIKKFVNNINASFSIWGFNISTPHLSRKNFISEYSSLLESKPLIIIIDDLERKSDNILIEDIMGMIEEFSQFNNVKLVIIGDENNIKSEDSEKWEKFKEKIIEKEYTITSFSDEAINNIVNEQIINYIDKRHIEQFTNDFIKKHNIHNLRTIIKGINFFKEIINNYVKIKTNKKANLMILKNCMAVAIESFEQLYKPTEEEKTKNPFLYAIDENLSSRIDNHYFNSMSINNNDSCILDYIIRIFNCHFDKYTIDSLNEEINNYLNIKTKEQNIFYLSKNQITKKMIKLYKNLCNNTYVFYSLDNFINDFYQLILWNDILSLNFDNDKLKNCFNKSLFTYYYNANNNIYQNKIDRFELMRKESDLLSNLIDNYNEDVEIKYIDDKFVDIENSYKEKKYNIELLEWLDVRLIQQDKEIVRAKFMEYCRMNNFFLPDLNEEINKSIWLWTKKIWKIFYERMNKNDKEELNIYAESIKNNELSAYRISSLQDYRPMIENNKN